MSTGELLMVQPSAPVDPGVVTVESLIAQFDAAILEVRALRRARSRGLGGDGGCRR